MALVFQICSFCFWPSMHAFLSWFSAATCPNPVSFAAESTSLLGDWNLFCRRSNCMGQPVCACQNFAMSSFNTYGNVCCHGLVDMYFSILMFANVGQQYLNFSNFSFVRQRVQTFLFENFMS